MGWREQVEAERGNSVPDVWRDGCAALSRNCCELLRAVGVPVTKANILAVLEGMSEESWPGDWSCGWHLKTLQAEADAGRFPFERAAELTEYFLLYVARLRSRRMLGESLRGALEGLTLDTELPFAEEVEGSDEPTRGTDALKLIGGGS